MLDIKYFRSILPLVILAAIVIMLLATMMTHASPLSVTLTPVSDTTISIISPNMNFGHDSRLTVEYQSSLQISRALIRFNLAAALPSNAVIDSAWLNLKQEGGQGEGSLTVYLVTQDWIEGQVTWDSQPAVGEPILSKPCDSTSGVKGLEITDIVRAWHNTPHYGLEIRGPEGGAAYIRLFESREQGEYPPTLSVIYHLPSPSPTPLPTPTPTQPPIPTPTQPPIPTPTAGPTQGWCCLNGEVYQTTQTICSLEGGQFFETEEEAYQACESQPPTGWCCLNGEVFPAPEPVCLEEGGQFFETEEEAAEACQTQPTQGWCCLNGEVFPASEDDCYREGGQFFETEEEAVLACQEQPRLGWCCLNGNVFQTYEDVCFIEGGQFFESLEAAQDYCWSLMPTATPTSAPTPTGTGSTPDLILDPDLEPPDMVIPSPGPELIFPTPEVSCAKTSSDIDGDCKPNTEDPDMDGDGIKNEDDKCEKVYNPAQLDCESAWIKLPNGKWQVIGLVGQACKGDGWADACDNCPRVMNPSQWDSDSDGVGNACDNCISTANPGTYDSSMGGYVQADSDNDGVGDACDKCPGEDDENDSDNDEIPNSCDNCPQDWNKDQKDTDNDSIGDECDDCPKLSNSLDSDNDGVPDCSDVCAKANDKVDKDNDGVPDCVDNCPGLANSAYMTQQQKGSGKLTYLQGDQDGDGEGDDCDCDDNWQGLNEKGVDCGGICTPCGYISIKGRILYEDASADGKTSTGFKPVRYGRFQLRICNDYPCTTQVKYYEKLTDSQGYFNIVTERQGIKSAYVYLGSQTGWYKANYAVRIARDADGCNEYVYWYGKTVPIPQTGDLNFGDLRVGINKNLEFAGNWRETTSGFCAWDGKESGPVNGGSGYFNIAETILIARQYADALRDDNDSIGTVDVEWPDSEKSSYNSYWEEIQLLPGSGFNDGTICHEFAHHLEEEISENDDYWGSGKHSLCSADKDEEFGWKEGFAEYFGTVVPHNHQSPDPKFLSNPNVGESTAENQASCPTSNEEVEATVLAVLWDLVDDPTNSVPHPYKSGVTSTFPLSVNESFDTVSGKEALIFSIFDNECDNFADAPDLCEFIEEGWDCRLSGKQRDAIDAILKHYNVKCSRGCGK